MRRLLLRYPLPYSRRSPRSPLAARARCGGHELKCRAGAGDAKLYYARKLLRIDQNECVHRTSIVWSMWSVLVTRVALT